MTNHLADPDAARTAAPTPAGEPGPAPAAPAANEDRLGRPPEARVPVVFLAVAATWGLIFALLLLRYLAG